MRFDGGVRATSGNLYFQVLDTGSCNGLNFEDELRRAPPHGGDIRKDSPRGGGHEQHVVAVPPVAADPALVHHIWREDEVPLHLAIVGDVEGWSAGKKSHAHDYTDLPIPAKQ